MLCSVIMLLASSVEQYCSHVAMIDEDIDVEQQLY
jgi:hypothetical protein